MTHNFEIKVQCKGDAAGTLGWLNSILADGELVIKNTKKGSAGLFFHEKHDKQGVERKENEGLTFICRPYVPDEDAFQYDTKLVNGITFLCARPQENEYEYGFTDFALTPSAKEKLQEFIDSAVHQFAEWWSNQ